MLGKITEVTLKPVTNQSNSRSEVPSTIGKLIETSKGGINPINQQPQFTENATTTTKTENKKDIRQQDMDPVDLGGASFQSSQRPPSQMHMQHTSDQSECGNQGIDLDIDLDGVVDTLDEIDGEAGEAICTAVIASLVFSCGTGLAYSCSTYRDGKRLGEVIKEQQSILKNPEKSYADRLEVKNKLSQIIDHDVSRKGSSKSYKFACTEASLTIAKTVVGSYGGHEIGDKFREVIPLAAPVAAVSIGIGCCIAGGLATAAGSFAQPYNI